MSPAQQPAPGKTVRCPACGGSSVYAPSNPYRPFCGERCKNLDFGAWASERFTLPTEAPQDDPDFERLHPLTRPG